MQSELVAKQADPLERQANTLEPTASANPDEIVDHRARRSEGCGAEIASSDYQAPQFVDLPEVRPVVTEHLAPPQSGVWWRVTQDPARCVEGLRCGEHAALTAGSSPSAVASWSSVASSRRNTD